MMVAEQTMLRGELRQNESMSRHTSWRVGGPAQRWYRPADVDDLAKYFASIDASEPVYWVGLGSNLLVRDGGINGTVICTNGTLDRIDLQDGDRFYVEAGVACPKLARVCQREGFSGAEFLAGIPGTIGGALAMNAGCFGSEIWQFVQSVVSVDRLGTLHIRKADEYEVSYRSVVGKGEEWFAGAYLAFPRGDNAATRERMRAYLEKRAATQPLGSANAGSVFRNPPGNHAARLIEACGLKGRAIGDAEVSQKHANFIINRGSACAADIEALIEVVQKEVALQTGVVLQPEVRIVGERSAS